MRNGQSGLTLFGFFAVLVVLGLAVGALLTHHSAVRASQARSDISEVEKYQAAAKLFRDKYAYLPGDMPGGLAAKLKFTMRAGARGRGDGNGLVEGYAYLGSQVRGTIQTGEPLFFWEDLYSALLIQQPFTKATDLGLDSDVTDAMEDYLPDTGAANRIYVYSDKGVNYYGLSAVTKIDGIGGELTSHPGLSASEAYAIDRKLDDGVANSGKVTARYVDNGVQDSPSSATPSYAFCYDAASGRYEQSGGHDASCALSFVFASP
jgi:hypothetical protein